MIGFEIEGKDWTIEAVIDVEADLDSPQGVYAEYVQDAKCICHETGDYIDSPLTDSDILAHADADDDFCQRARDSLGIGYRGLGGNDPDGLWAYI